MAIKFQDDKPGGGPASKPRPVPIVKLEDDTPTAPPQKPVKADKKAKGR